jgi:hypothetical protein
VLTESDPDCRGKREHNRKNRASQLVDYLVADDV